MIKAIKRELSAVLEKIIYLPSFSANTDSSLMLNGQPKPPKPPAGQFWLMNDTLFAINKVGEWLSCRVRQLGERYSSVSQRLA